MTVYTIAPAPATRFGLFRGGVPRPKTYLVRCRYSPNIRIVTLAAYVAIGLAVTLRTVTAQPIRNEFRHLSVRDGLSHNSVNCIFQDREGFIWFGTNDGLNKYDGYTFTVFQPDPDNPGRSFRNNRIMGICEARQNRLWVVTEGGGLHEVDKQTGEVTPHPIKSDKANRWNSQLSVYEDSQGVLWISTYDGIARYQPSEQQFRLYPSPRPEMQIKNVFEDRQHRFWAATSQGLYLVDRTTGRYTPVAVSGSPGLQPVFNSFYADAQDVLWIGSAGDGLFRINLRSASLRPVAYNPGGKINRYLYLNAIHRDRQGDMWLATTEGLQQIDTRTDQVITYRPDPGFPNGISGTNAQAVLHDRAGVLWVGTNNGIDQQAVTAKPFVTYQVKPGRGTANLPENKVNSLLLDERNRFWLSNQQSLYRLEPGKTQAEQISPRTLGSVAPYTNHTFSMLSDGAGGVWFGTWNGLYRYDATINQYIAYPSEVPTQFISRGPTSDIWAGGEGGIASFNPRTQRYTYYKYDPADTRSLPDKFVYAVLASRTGDVWVAVNGKGISRLNPRMGRFTHYTASSQVGSLNSNEVLTFYEDPTGLIWIGTNQGGLNGFDPRSNRFSHYTTRHGLPSNRIVGITGDAAGQLWLSTNRGLCRFDPRTKAVRNYDASDGLPSDDFLENAVFRRGKQLYFGSLNGLVQFNPDSIRDDRRPFPVFITGFKVMDKSRPLPAGDIELAHDENFLSFEFAALTYVLPEKNQYAYQLVGIDDDWVQNGTRRFVNYTNLPPGNYLFRVKASNSDGVWNLRGRSVRLLIHPPWWRSWWAYAVYLLLATGAVVGVVRAYANRVRQRQELELNRREAEQLKRVDELKSRFFSNITHEFRTPLTLILGPVDQLLQETPSAAPNRRGLTLIQRNAHRLLQLVNQLLDLSKLEANSMAVVLNQGRVVDFVGQLVESFRSAAQLKNISLTYSADTIDEEYQFDADKWQKILSNLLSNALKFTKNDGQIAVTLSLPEPASAEASPMIQITVADTGVGISSANLPYIFDRFYQVDDSKTRTYEGTGIGLALVKELTELLGGTIQVNSEPEAGTSFRLLLPVQPASDDALVSAIVLPDNEMLPVPVGSSEYPGDAGKQGEPIAPGESGQPLILVVEDNTELRDFIVRGLSASYRLLTATDGEEGWRITQEELPDVVLSDVMMPGMDGYELTRLIKTTPATDHIAVILLTAKAAHHSQLEGLREGADHYMTKPFDVNELHLRLGNQIAHQQKVRQQYLQRLDQPDESISPELMKNPFLQKFYAILKQQVDNPDLDVEWLAKEVGAERRTLNRRLQSLTQLTASDLIRDYRLRESVRLLRRGINIAETAYAVGFKTPAHFTTVFKKFYGKTPTDFLAGR